MTTSQALQKAVQLHQTGRLAEAEALYRQILAVQPNHADALHFLGLVAHQAGRNDSAVELIRQSIALNPKNPVAYSNLGVACRMISQLDEATAAFRHALELKPDYPEAYINLGTVFDDRGELEEAIAAYRRALELKSDYPEAYNNLGNALRDQGQLDEAMAAYRRAVELKPGYPEAQSNLGNALREQGQFDAAVAACLRALQLQPDLPQGHNNLGNALRERGQLDEAEAEFRRALELKPDYRDAHNNLAAALAGKGLLDDAVDMYRRALQMKPDDASLHSSLVFTLQYLPGHDAKTIFEEHQRWNRQFGDPLKQSVLPHANDPAVARRLRVGYVSPDFRDHPVGRYVLPLLERHDREQLEIFCYSGVARPDWITERLRALAGKWRNTIGVSDARLGEMIREDGVDILVDLAMHTADNRLPVFARRPAPVQVTWLGYPGSTGLQSIGYRLTDAHMELPGKGSALSSEEPVPLPDCWCCYVPLDEYPEVNALPVRSTKGVTFGSLNNFSKVNDGVLALWARMLNAIGGSRLMMLCPAGRSRERVHAFLGALGIAADRVELVGFLPRSEYVKLYQRIDLGLDPFPCNGMTTTCDALWMGVPVLTLPGAMPASRAGLSLLSSVGLEELAASSEEDYVRIAVELAGNLPRLADLRAALRPRMQASPLMDAPRFARNVEAAYRTMWRTWCVGQRIAKDES